MGLDYALVHLQYTIPPAIILTLLYKPLFSRLDVYRICFLVIVSNLGDTCSLTTLTLVSLDRRSINDTLG